MSVIKVPISEVVDVNPRIPTTFASDLNREVDFVPMAQLSEQGYVTPNESRQLREVLKGYTYFENGDVIIAKITPCMENGKAAFVDTLPHQIGFGSTEFHVLRPRDSVDGRYLFYMVWNSEFRNEAEGNMTGSAGQKRVPKAFFDRFEIPLPPLSDQKRIADILDKADSIRRKRQEAVSVHESLLSTAFAHCVGNLAGDYSDWPQTTLGDLAEFVGGSSLPMGELFKGQNGGLLLVKVGDMNLPGNEFRMSTAREWIASAVNKYAFCPRNAIVIPKRGGAIGTNKKRLLDRDSLLDPNLMGIVPKNLAHAAWLFQWFQHFDLLQLVSGSAVPQLNKKDLSPLVLIEPPLKNLTLFENASKAIRQSQDRAINASNVAENLFNCLVQRAFRGEL